jgi:hypothetical protein
LPVASNVQGSYNIKLFQGFTALPTGVQARVAAKALNPYRRKWNPICKGLYYQHLGKWEYVIMAKRRGNPNWGKPEPIGPVVPTPTEFEQVVKEFKLTPDQFQRSTRLREWARRNKNSKYIPEPLLQAWGFEIESSL